MLEGYSAGERARSPETENPPIFLQYGLTTQPAFSVRGSFRQITIVRFRLADIRVINRRIYFSSYTRSAALPFGSNFFETKTQPGST